MDIILFFVLAIATIIISIKLSYYADMLDKYTNFGGLLIGGFLLAGSTSLPELITSISSVSLKNPSLALGDILGSNIFNICIIAFFNILYIKRRFMDKITYKYTAIHLITIYVYITLISYFKGDLVGGIVNIGIPSFIIFFCYLIYIVIITKSKIEETPALIKKKEENIGFKFSITVIFLVLISILLTYQVNDISIKHPSLTSSIYGAFLLGVTTSLPEVVSVITLLKIKSYNLAYSNIIGSNMINFLILAIIDTLFMKKFIYDFYDMDTIYLSYVGLGFTIVLLYTATIKRQKSIILYIIPYILILGVYIWFSFFYLLS